MFSVILMLAAPSAAQASPASAQPITYTCKFTDPGAAEVRFTIDESTSMVTMYVPKTNHHEMMVGTFSGGKVSFSNQLISYAMDPAQGSIVRMVPKANYKESGFCLAT
jgi:hypothetical protein